MGDTEELDALIQEAVKQQTQRMAKAIVGFLVAITTAGAGFLGAGGLEPVARPDPFTGTDGMILRLEVINECRKYTDSRFTEHSKHIPPTWTRARINELESHMEKLDPTYNRPTREW